MTIVVTGGGRGIGAAVARALAGQDVCIGYRADAASADAVVAGVRAAGGRAVAVRAETTDAAAVRALFDAAGSLGAVTGLVNNAGVTSRLGPLAELAEDDLRAVVDVNVVGYLLCAREAVRRMSTARGGVGGAIVNISSAAATLGSPGEYVHYAATKAATDALTVGLAKEVAAEGIRVNAVAPGIVRTDIHAASGAPDRADTAASRIPLGRAGEPDEVAAAVAWLLSDAASYTTGAVLRVAGGL